jgi:hypothetical protein
MSDSNDSIGIEPARLIEAFELVRPEMLLLKESELLPVNLDPLASVSVVRGALPGLLALRPTIANTFRNFDLTPLERLELYAFALTQAQVTCQSVSKRTKTLSKLSAAAVTLRARLLQDAQALVLRGQVSESRLSQLKGAKGHCNIASDLLLLVTSLRECWSDVVGKTGVTLDELNAAELLGNRLVEAIGARKFPALARRAAADRQRAYTLFIRAYDQVRRVVTFLRWDTKDIDLIAPSLYTKKLKSRRSQKQTTKKTTIKSTTCCIANSNDTPRCVFNASCVPQSTINGNSASVWTRENPHTVRE